MTRPLPVLEGRFDHAVLVTTDRDGYPLSVAVEFRHQAADGVLRLARPAMLGAEIAAGSPVNVMLSHIRPRPGAGYDERRYVSVWGPVVAASERELSVRIERSEHWDEQTLPFPALCERAVPRARRYLAALSARLGREVRPQLATPWLLLRATRLPFLTGTLVSVFLGLAIAAKDAPFRWGLALLTVIAACAVHAGLNVANDVFDTLSGADAANATPTPFSGGSRVVVHGLLTMRQLVAIGVVCYAIGLGIGLHLAIERGFWPLAAIGVAGAVVSLEYTAPPLRLVYHGLGEVAVVLGFGPIMTLGAYYVEAQRWSWEAFYASLPVGILIALILYVNEIPDRHGDAAAGKRTLPVRLPREAVIRGYAVSAWLAFALIAAGALLGWMPRPTLIALAAAAMVPGVVRGLRAGYDDAYALVPAMARNIQLHLVTGILMVVGYVAALAVG